MEESKYPSEAADRFMVRMPDGMRDRIAEMAKQNGRSMNAEVVARLEGSFVPLTLPQEIEDEVKRYAARVNLSFDEALEKIIYAGTHPNAPEVAVFRPEPGMTMEDMRTMLEVAKPFFDPRSAVIFDNRKTGLATVKRTVKK